jgi:hypothetical protein
MLAFFDIGGIIDTKLAELWAKVGDKWADLWSPISDAWPLWWSWGMFGLVVIGCLFLAVFLQFKWLRLGLLGVIVAAAAWLWGSVRMYGEMKAKLDAERKRRRK